MPNWIRNEVVVKDWDVFEEKIISIDENGNPFINFNKLIPMPDDFIKKAEEFEQKRQGVPIKDWKPIPREIDPYYWCIANWSVKWNSMNNIIDKKNNVVVFNTAWDPPYKIFLELSKYTDLLILYADEDIGNNYGAYTIINGEIDLFVDCIAQRYGESYACMGVTEKLFKNFLNEILKDNEFRVYLKNNSFVLNENERSIFCDGAMQDYQDANKIINEKRQLFLSKINRSK